MADDHIRMEAALIARDEVTQHTLYFINSWREQSLSLTFQHIGEGIVQVGDLLDILEDLLEDKLQRLPPIPLLTIADVQNLTYEILEITDVFEKFADQILIPLSVVDLDDMALPGDDFARLNIRASRFLFTYREAPWLPGVIHLVESFCWVWSVSQLLRATYSFQHLRLGPPLSMQCIINGIPTYAEPGDINNVNILEGTYESTACIALRYVQRRGCDLDVNVPYVRRVGIDMPYLRIAEIQEDPFSIHPDTSIHSIRAAMQDYGCLVGVFEVDQTFALYGGPPNVYFIERAAKNAENDEDRSLHYALICGVGSLDDVDDGRAFLQIQNSYGANWGDGGYGYIAKDLFHHIHGVRGVTLMREE